MVYYLGGACQLSQVCFTVEMAGRAHSFRIIPGRRPIEKVALAELGIGWRHNNGPQRLNHRSFLFVTVGQEELGEP